MRSLPMLCVLLALPLGCRNFPDPAVRIANCIVRGVEAAPAASEPFTLRCDIDLPGGYLVLFHPEGELSDEQLLAAGLPRERLAELRSLRLGPWPSIYVLPNDPKQALSRTTSQRSAVGIPTARFALHTSEEALRIVIGGPPGERSVLSVE